MILFLVLITCTVQIFSIQFVVPGSPKQSYIPANPEERLSSYPYISGDTFRAACDFVIDKTKVPFDPDKISDGDTIFLNADFLPYFFGTIHPTIRARYILVTHNSIKPIPGEFAQYLDDQNLVAWFGKINMKLDHCKMFSLPLGIANRYWSHGNTALIDEVRNNYHQKKNLLYMNFDTRTNRVRRNVFNFFSKKRFCIVARRKSCKQYLQDLTESKFVLSPPGSCLDCHRIWETLLMGAIPIVKRSKLDIMFEDLPVLIIDDWKIITYEFLTQKYEEMKNKQYNYDKLFAEYWIQKIMAVKRKIRENP